MLVLQLELIASHWLAKKLFLVLPPGIGYVEKTGKPSMSIPNSVFAFFLQEQLLDYSTPNSKRRKTRAFS